MTVDAHFFPEYESFLKCKKRTSHAQNIYW